MPKARHLIECVCAESEETHAVLAEPNTPAARQFGRERPDPKDPQLLRGEFGTLRALKRVDGAIIGGMMIGRRSGSKEWQLLLMAVLPAFRRQGVALELLRRLKARVGKIAHASQYTDDGQQFIDAAPTRALIEATESDLAAWFGDSVAVDAQGQPALLYHGSRSAEAFATFDTEHGAYFTTDESYAEGFKETRMYRAYVKVCHPKRFDGEDQDQFTAFTDARVPSAELIAAGFDGELLTFADGEYDIRVVRPDQIRVVSVT